MIETIFVQLFWAYLILCFMMPPIAWALDLILGQPRPLITHAPYPTNRMQEVFAVGEIVTFPTKKGRYTRTGQILAYERNRGKVRVRLLGLPGNRPTLRRRASELAKVA